MGFLIIGGIGLAILVVSLFAGEVLDTGDLLGSDIFSIASIAAFVAAFGFTAAATDTLTTLPALPFLAGALGGAAFSALTIWLTRHLKNSRTDATITADSLVGHEGRVLTAIPADGFGQVTLRLAGQRLTYSARAATALDSGTRVWVSQVLSPTAVEVAPTEEPLHP
ncbi:NfeD family protein [Mariniluteicoccus flavus]